MYNFTVSYEGEEGGTASFNPTQLCSGERSQSHLMVCVATSGSRERIKQDIIVYRQVSCMQMTSMNTCEQPGLIYICIYIYI